ncbi:MAG: sigma-70 family RNA polymerase sigma factor [Actinobacteria bacterium]|nr:MAG: sigma-70 family RNA polymerase sigma factor [Actinomycetota bacterium]
MSPMALSLRFLQAQPDGRLTQLAREGHEPAFEALVRRYRRELFCYCRRLMPEAASAEDTVQQALLQAWRALKAGAEVRDIRAWLYRIAHNAAVSHLRAAGAMPREMEDAPGTFDVEQVVQQRLRAKAALAGMASLPELQRRVLVSTTLDGASHEEVATALGLSNGAVRGLIYRARAALRATAAAVSPIPGVGWAIRHAASRSKRTHAVVEAALGGGGAGIAGLMAKGGALIAITGAVAGGGMIVSPTTSHHQHSEVSQPELHGAGDSSVSAVLLAHQTHGPLPGSRTANTSASPSGARRSSDSRSGPANSTGSTTTATSGHDGGLPGGSDGGSRGGPTATTTPSGTSGPDGGSPGSTGSGDTTTTATH